LGDYRQLILKWIDEDQKQLVNFVGRLLRAKSPNPPGDTRDVSREICILLEKMNLPFRVIDPKEEMPNIISTFDFDSPGRHLILNGHMDVFPVGPNEEWTVDPWGGIVKDGRIYGRGAADMKCGLASLVFAYTYLHRLRDRLKGRITLTCVSDEETFGLWGAQYLVENCPEVLGDCFLSGDGPYGITFGDRGFIWLTFRVRTVGAHGAYTHLSPNAIKIAGSLITDLESITDLEFTRPENVKKVLKTNIAEMDNSQGSGASDVGNMVTLNIGTIRGGVKTNMIPAECVFDADFRIPLGLEKDTLMDEIRKVASRYPECEFEEVNHSYPNWSDPYGEMVTYIQSNSEKLKGLKPQPLISLGGTDARHWRRHHIPAYLYGPIRHNLAAADENVEVDEFISLVKCHTLSACDYLSK
jgi:succinyl-diaminopimelate desuccinylase